MEKKGDNPTVSVIIPTHNRAPLIGRAIQSVLNQTYQDFEIIVVDDGSTDNTEEVVKNFTDERLRYIRLEENSGTSAVPRNTGIRVARGEFYAGADDDCEWLPEKLEKQVKAFEEASPKVGVVYTAMLDIIGNERIYLRPPDTMQKEGNIHKEILTFGVVWNSVWNPVLLVKKECFNRVGMFDEKLPGFLEWDMALRLSKYYDFKYIDELLVILYYSPDTSHYSQAGLTRRWMFILDKHFQEFKEIDKKLLAKRYFDIGTVLGINENLIQFAEGRRCLWKAFRLNPLGRDYALTSLISLFGPAFYHKSFLRSLYRRLKRILARI